MFSLLVTLLWVGLIIETARRAILGKLYVECYSWWSCTIQFSSIHRFRFAAPCLGEMGKSLDAAKNACKKEQA